MKCGEALELSNACSGDANIGCVTLVKRKFENCEFGRIMHGLISGVEEAIFNISSTPRSVDRCGWFPVVVVLVPLLIAIGRLVIETCFRVVGR